MREPQPSRAASVGTADSQEGCAPEALATCGPANPVPLPVGGARADDAARVVQRREATEPLGRLRRAEAPIDVQAAARQGVASPQSPLPFAATIQAAFGHHDLSGVRAHTGPGADVAAAAMGAQAFTTNDHVVMRPGSDLFTAAHEAAHVVQQRAGVQVQGGVGSVGDAHEQHADRVAARVVRGESAASLLDEYAAGGRPARDLVQRRMIFGPGTEYLDIDGAGRDISLAGYRATQTEAKTMVAPVTVVSGPPAAGAACYTPVRDDPEVRQGAITIRPLQPQDIEAENSDYHDRLISMAHETRHAVDDLNRDVRDFRTSDSAKIRTEWRAFATQSAVAMELRDRREPFPDRFMQDIASFANVQAFTAVNSRMFATTSSYMQLYGLTPAYPDPAVVTEFMEAHLDWVQEAINLFHQLIPQQVAPQQAEEVFRPAGNGDGWGKTVAGLAVAGGVALTGILYWLAKNYGYL